MKNNEPINDEEINNRIFNWIINILENIDRIERQYGNIDEIRKRVNSEINSKARKSFLYGLLQTYNIACDIEDEDDIEDFFFNMPLGTTILLSKKIINEDGANKIIENMRRHIELREQIEGFLSFEMENISLPMTYPHDLQWIAEEGLNELYRQLFILNEQGVIEFIIDDKPALLSDEPVIDVLSLFQFWEDNEYIEVIKQNNARINKTFQYRIGSKLKPFGSMLKKIRNNYKEDRNFYHQKIEYFNKILLK